MRYKYVKTGVYTGVPYFKVHENRIASLLNPNVCYNLRQVSIIFTHVLVHSSEDIFKTFKLLDISALGL